MNARDASTLSARTRNVVLRFQGPLSRLALPALLVLAAANFLWQLGSSSYFVDEIQSIVVSSSPIGDVWHALSKIELTPPAYFYFQHEWVLRTGVVTEWVTRLPSALCGVVLVAAVYWLASVLTERRAVALAAGALTGLSPFVLEYAQLAQGYVFVMLAVTAAVAAALQARRPGSRSELWLASAAGAAILALWLHYTASLVVLPLCTWVATRDTFPKSWRSAFVGACVLADLALVPLLLAQHQSIPVRTGAGDAAGVTTTNIARIFATPLDGRADALLVLAAAVTVAALLALFARRRAISRELRLLAMLAGGVPLALLVLSALGAHLMLTRYAAAGAPFMIVAIAAAVVTARPRPLGALLAVGALIVAGAGLLASHRKQGFYLDARGAARYVRSHERPGDAVLAPASPGTAIPLTFYGLRPTGGGGSTERQHLRRLWVVFDLAGPPASATDVLRYVRRILRPLGYDATHAEIFPGVVPLAVVLEVPLSSRPQH